MPRRLHAPRSSVLGAVLLIAACAQPPRPPLEGAWKIVDVVTTGADSATNHNPQASLYLFGPRHYSIMAVTGTTPRTLYKTETPTDSERIASYNSFVANTGTYEIADSTLTLHPVVARFPNLMAGGFNVYHYRMAGDTLWLTSKSTDMHIRMGDQVVASAPPESVTHTKLVRDR